MRYTYNVKSTPFESASGMTCIGSIILNTHRSIALSAFIIMNHSQLLSRLNLVPVDHQHSPPHPSIIDRQK